MADTNEKVVSALSQKLGGGSNFQKSNVQYQEKVRAYDSGLDHVANAFGQRVKVERAEERIKERERELSSKATGELKARAGAELPIDSDETTKTSFKTTTHMMSVDALMKKATPVFDTDDFQDLSDTAQVAKRDELRVMLGDSLAQSGVQDNTGSKEFISGQLKSLDLSFNSSRDKYRNHTLPRRTIGNMTDMLITGSADESTWTNTLALMKGKTVVGTMPAEEVTKVVYGEFTRAIESGNTEAYQALRKSDTWTDMSTPQKEAVEGAYNKEVVEQRNSFISSTAQSIRGVAGEALRTGDLSKLDEVMLDLNKLNPTLAGEVYSKVRSTLAKVAPTRLSLDKLELVKAGSRDVVMTPTDAKTAYASTATEIYTKMGGTGSAQLARQLAGAELKQLNVLTEDTTKAYDFSTTFSEGKMNNFARQTWAGALRLETLNLTGLDVQDLMGKQTYNTFKQMKRIVATGVSPDIALAQIRDKEAESIEQTVSFKNAKAIKSFGKINQAGVFEDIWDTVTDKAGVFVNHLEFGGDFTSTIDTGLELATQAPLEEGQRGADGVTNEVFDAMASNNIEAAKQGFIEFSEDKDLWDDEHKIEAYEEHLEESGIISNNSLIVNDKLLKRLRTAIGIEDTRQVNDALSITTQALAPLMVMSGADQSAIMNTVTTVAVKGADGVFKFVTDDAERSRLFNVNKTRPNPNVKVGVDLAKYESLFNKGGELAGGRQVKAFQTLASDQVGGYDSRAWSRDFIQHKLAYSETLGSFVMNGLNRDGQALTLDTAISDTRRVGTEDKVFEEVPKGMPLSLVLDEATVTMFMRAFTTQQ